MVTFLVMVKLWEIFANIWVVGVRDRWWWWWCWTRGSDAIATAPKCQIPEAEHKWQILQLLPCKTKDLEHKLERQHDGATRDMHRLQYLPLFLEPHTLWLTTMSGQEGGRWAMPVSQANFSRQSWCRISWTIQFFTYSQCNSQWFTHT